MKNLVIVESPTKAKTIGKFLGDDYTIKFSMGHILDLPKSKLGIDVENNFSPQYEVIEDKKQIIVELKAAAKSADTIIIATDPDREGEAIAANIKEVLSENKNSSGKFKRIVFHEITEGAVKQALQSPRDVDEHLVGAQTARRVLDRLVGYQLSPVLWKKIRRGLSAGRVQSVALRLIVEREKEIKQFAKQNYWTVFALLGKTNNQAVAFELIEINNEKIEIKETHNLYDGEYTATKTTIDREEKANQIVRDLRGRTFVVSDINQRQVRRSPYAPFTTSTLQQEASRRLGLSGRWTMSLAQKLYEEGFITYHRTDSVTLSTGAVSQMRSYIKSQYGDRYISESPRIFTAKQKLAQEAHEGVRPTDVRRQTSDVRDRIGNDYAKLYDLIWRRALASQMADAVIESTTVFVDAMISHPGVATTVLEGGTTDRIGSPAGDSIASLQNDNTYRLKATGSVLLFDGFLKLNPQVLQDVVLPKFVVQETLNLKDCNAVKHETLPPSRYNDASLIGTLEEKGIGRPSTYASIISTLVDRAYVERLERRFVPTPIGIAVNDFLVANFSTIDDIPFTAKMEDELDSIAHGQKAWVDMMKDFYQPFEEKVISAEDAERIKIETEQTNEMCPECGSPLVIRHGRFGKFLSCSTFPECKFTKSLVEETNLTCPKDGGKVIVKKTRKGRRFFGCSNYPKCDFAAWKLEDIKKGGSGNSSKRTKSRVNRGSASLRAAKKRNMVKRVVRKSVANP